MNKDEPSFLLDLATAGLVQNHLTTKRYIVKALITTDVSSVYCTLCLSGCVWAGLLADGHCASPFQSEHSEMNTLPHKSYSCQTENGG